MNLSIKTLAAAGSAFLAILGLATLLWAQSNDFAPASVSPTTGTFDFTFTVTISSTLPKNSILVCSASALVSEAGPAISQKATGIGTVSGTTGTCKITMPYSWALATPTTDKVALSYTVEADYVYQATATNGATVGTELVPLDKVGENLATISVPLSGATTNEAVSTRI